MIRLTNIEKHYTIGQNTIPILSDINLEISSGEFTAIMGPSGSGKSTMMNILGLLDRPSSGKYFFNDEDVAAFDEKQLASLRNLTVGFIFQSFMLMPRMNLIENISLPLLYQHIPPDKMVEKSKELLSKMGLLHLASRKPPELSGGQQQRVAIARALVTKPKIVLADEPTGALDSHTGQEIFALLKDLNQNENTTIIIVTHDIKIAEQCKRIIYLHDGKIIPAPFLN